MASGGTGFLSTGIDFTHVDIDLLGTLCGFLHVAADLLGRGALLLDGGGNRVTGFADLANSLGETFNCRDGGASGSLDLGDLRGNPFRRLGGLRDQALYFGSDYGESLAGIAGSSRLDRGIQGHQIGLTGDVVDQIDHFADLLRDLGEALDLLRGSLGLGYRTVGEFARCADLARDFLDRRRHLLRRRGNGLHIGACLNGGGRDGGRLLR